MAGLTLTRKAINLIDNPKCKVWSIEVTAESSYADLDASIFVYHATTNDDPIEGDQFSNVASLSDMNTIPKNTPAVIDETGAHAYSPFYRISSVTLDCVSPEELDRCWKIIQYDTHRLVRDYKSSRNLLASETKTYE